MDDKFNILLKKLPFCLTNANDISLIYQKFKKMPFIGFIAI